MRNLELYKIMEYAKLSGASYKSEAEMRDFLSSEPCPGKKYTVIKYRDNPKSGFQGYLLKDTLDARYVFSFRGTEFIREPVKDTILTDAHMMLLGAPRQMYDALEFVAEMQREYGLSEDDTIFTGHSLGGSLAAMAGYVFGFEAYAYNPYGIGKLIRSAGSGGGFNIKKTIGEHMKELGVDVKKSEKSIHSYVNLGMFAPDFVAGLLTYMTVSFHVGEVQYLKDAPGNWLSIIDKHTVGKTLENLGSQRWADEAEAKGYFIRCCEKMRERKNAAPPRRRPLSAAGAKYSGCRSSFRRPRIRNKERPARRKTLTQQRIAYIFLRYFKFLKGGR
ncbi:MAG: hypothetical protein LUG14_02115 [Synergistaceae bacterium]|nr:hypothetical protein [Synergistaceae bacterium]